MASFLKKLGNASRLQAEIAGTSGDPDAIDLMSTHPRTIDRVQKALVAANEQQVANPVIGRDLFLDQVDGVLFGSDPKHGMVRDRVFLHGGLDFRFEVPPGFRIFNQPERVWREIKTVRNLFSIKHPHPEDRHRQAISRRSGPTGTQCMIWRTSQ